MKMILRAALVGSVLVSASIAGAQAVKAESFDEKTELFLQEAYEAVSNVFTHGVPSAEDLDGYKAKGVRVVFDLRGPTEKPVIEELVNSKGMVYHQIPYLKEGNIDGEAIAAVDKLLSEFEQNNKDIKFLVNCASSNRAGSWFAIHFKSRNPEATIDEAIEAGKKAGLKSEGLIAKTRKYLEEKAY